MMADSRTENRRFGLVMAVALSVLGTVNFALGGRAAAWLIGAAVLMAVAAVAVPAVLHPLRIAWMKFARVLGIVNSWIILTVIFALVITPVALLLRMFGRLSLVRGPEPEQTTYWQIREPEDFAANRMERQF